MKNFVYCFFTVVCGLYTSVNLFCRHLHNFCTSFLWLGETKEETHIGHSWDESIEEPTAQYGEGDLQQNGRLEWHIRWTNDDNLDHLDE